LHHLPHTASSWPWWPCRKGLPRPCRSSQASTAAGRRSRWAAAAAQRRRVNRCWSARTWTASVDGRPSWSRRVRLQYRCHGVQAVLLYSTDLQGTADIRRQACSVLATTCSRSKTLERLLLRPGASVACAGFLAGPAQRGRAAPQRAHGLAGAVRLQRRARRQARRRSAPDSARVSRRQQGMPLGTQALHPGRACRVHLHSLEQASPRCCSAPKSSL